MVFKVLKDIEIFLSTYIPNSRSKRMDYSLSNMRLFLEFLGNPQDSYKTIHIAGTSGKTSTAYYISSLLRQQGLKVGLSVSPHVFSLNERAQINMQTQEESEFCSDFSEFFSLINKFNHDLVYFEVITAFAFWRFSQKKVDYAVIETGLGGLLDPTNTINRADKVSVLTDIGLDHTRVLGISLEEIARQKAGIMNLGSVAFCNEQSIEVLDVFSDYAKERNSVLNIIPELRSDSDSIIRLSSKSLPYFQRRNWGLALACFEHLVRRDGLGGMSLEQMTKSSGVYIPGRMEVFIEGNSTIVFDVAHNPQKAEALVASVIEKYPKEKFAVVISLLRSGNQRVEGVLRALVPIAESIIVVEFNSRVSARRPSMPASGIVDIAKSIDIHNAETDLNLIDPESIMEQYGRANYLFLGSFYFIEDALNTYRHSRQTITHNLN